ncbi:hypothetical protein [Streptomyces sp. NPDC046631]|uniref:hypothetical protein n=1 Tax=unclassified Streptomyces TaxID=2593676 RepID=UPI0033E42B18
METGSDALTRWCDQLPTLLVQARQAGVLDRVERDIVRIQQGGSATRAVERWMPPEPGGPARSWSDRPSNAMADIPGLRTTPGISAGQYACPRDRCERRERRDDHGHPPDCAAFGVPMRPT